MGKPLTFFYSVTENRLENVIQGVCNTICLKSQPSFTISKIYNYVKNCSDLGDNSGIVALIEEREGGVNINEDKLRHLQGRQIPAHRSYLAFFIIFGQNNLCRLRKAVFHCYSSLKRSKRKKKDRKSEERVSLTDPLTPSVFGYSDRKRIYFENTMAAYYRSKRGRHNICPREELLWTPLFSTCPLPITLYYTVAW
jgi:hypothetical protein